MEKQQLEKFKEALVKERAEINNDLANIAARSKKDPSEWRSKFISSDSETGHEARETAADESEEYGEQLAIAKSLAQKLVDIDLALVRIFDGTYGKCSNCGADISLERLEALPTASVCSNCGAAIGES